MTQRTIEHPVVAGYLAGLAPRYQALATALAEAVQAAAPELKPVIKYGQLCYSLGGAGRRAGCALSTAPKRRSAFAFREASG